MTENLLKKADFVSDQNVRWCPGCGDYIVLSSIQKILPTLGIPKENFAFISGIGCSSRLPYYIDTYGFHTIHGRAAAIASGLKLSRPDLSVWIATGDGDSLSIGGNHFLHSMRRNMDLNIILFNNRIYGLTKGQISPTSEMGKKTKTTPLGSLDNPMKPISVALGAEATFVARSMDVDPKRIQEILIKAAKHKGISFVEIYQNCVIFNHDAFAHLYDRSVREDRILILEHGKPMIFGKERDKGIRLNGVALEVVQLGDGITEEDLLVHNESDQDPSIAFMLSRMDYPEFPVPFGVFRSIVKKPYQELLTDQINMAIESKGAGDLEELFHSGHTWEIGN